MEILSTGAPVTMRTRWNMRHTLAISTCRRIIQPLLVAVLSVGLASCADIFLAINPNGAEGQVCSGLFVTGEEFDLCRRDADGALGAFDVFIEDLVVDADGNIVLAGSLVVGQAELTQSFESGADCHAISVRGIGGRGRRRPIRSWSLQP